MYVYKSRRRQPSEKNAPLSLRAPLLTQSQHQLQKPPSLLPPFPPPCRSPDTRPARFTRVGAELRHELLVVHEQGQEPHCQQHAGQGSLWAEARRQYREHALEPITQGPRRT